jgi:hypothetical protein
MKRGLGIAVASALWMAGMIGLISTVPERLPLCTNGQHKLFYLTAFEAPVHRCPNSPAVTETPESPIAPAPSVIRVLADPALSAKKPAGTPTVPTRQRAGV